MMSIRNYAIGAVAGACATLGVVAVSGYLQPANPIAVVNQSAQPLAVTYTLEGALGERRMMVPAGSMRSIPGALAYSDIDALAVDNNRFADWRVSRNRSSCSGDCTLLLTADGKIRLSV